MNPAIADMKDKWADRPAMDREWANFATVDEEKVYRVYVLTPSRVEWFMAQVWERSTLTVGEW